MSTATRLAHRQITITTAPAVCHAALAHAPRSRFAATAHNRCGRFRRHTRELLGNGCSPFRAFDRARSRPPPNHSLKPPRCRKALGARSRASGVIADVSRSSVSSILIERLCPTALARVAAAGKRTAMTIHHPLSAGACQFHPACLARLRELVTRPHGCRAVRHFGRASISDPPRAYPQRNWRWPAPAMKVTALGA